MTRVPWAPLLLVVGEEDLLQGRVGDLELGDAVAGERLDDRVGVAAEVEGDPAVLRRQVGHARDRLQLGRVDRLGERDRDTALGPAEHSSYVATTDAGAGSGA